jgi:8-oxo-dGTP pyrophosphatase MutT (NUDIX family)
VALSDNFTVVGTEHHYRGWVIDVRTDEVRMPDGVVAKRDVIAHPGAVGVLALDEADRVVMVRQYRHPVGDNLLELPAGLLDMADESALAAAQRELYEEAALRASDWSVLVDLYTSPGMTDEAIRIYLARGLTDVTEDEKFAAEHEEITMTVERIELDAVVELALSGELTNGPAVAGVLAARIARDRGWVGLRDAEAFWSARPQRARRSRSSRRFQG